jgi:hypothetical protein
MLIKNTALVDLDGKPLTQPKPPESPPTPLAPGQAPPPPETTDVTVATILVNCCLTPAEQGRTYSGEKVAARYDIAIQLHRAKIDDSIEVPLDLVADLKKDVLRLYAPIISGQMMPCLEGKN